MTSNGVNGTAFDVLCQTTSTDSEKIARFPSLVTEHETMQSQLKCHILLMWDVCNKNYHLPHSATK